MKAIELYVPFFNVNYLVLIFM